MTLRQLTDNSIDRLSPLYETSEARWLVRTALEHFTGMSRTDMMLRSDQEASEMLIHNVSGVIDRLLDNEPIQYILGETYWHGLTLKVTPDVLIPRVETSELIDIINDDYAGRSDLKVLDLCTGSGCIAIALARALPFSRVTATDISAGALRVARENAADCKVKITFQQGDLLAGVGLPEGSMDIIVSNPPYICDSEKAGMSANVLDYEPHSALFVPDDDPLKFYRAISREGIRLAVAGGRLYLEINPLHVSELTAMLADDGWTEVEALKDMHGRERFVKALKPAD
ncbi:MAG: peptide chain release factor N(5)-glutamine methyltransferase [Bacteroides sp.]|nr:peptide chain release factor N(5)-glutamine methyltransferase [Bacteroides sp.]